MSAPIKVKCPHCSTLLRFAPTGAVSMLKCPKCQKQLRIKTPSGASPNPAPGQVRRPAAAGSTVGRTAAQTSRPAPARSPARSPDLDWDDLASPPPRGPVPDFQSSPSSRTGPPGGFYVPPGDAPRNRRSGGGVMKPILIGCGLLGGLGVLGVVGLVAVLVYFGSTAESKSTISLAGYSVDAPGKVVPESKQGGAVSHGIHHRRTNSEFAISTKQVAAPGQNFELEKLIQMMRQLGSNVRSQTPISRAGLSGYQMKMRGVTGLETEVEVYKINAQDVLLLTYVSGKVKHDAGMGKLDRDPETIQKLDDPDAFFSSLRKN